MFTPGYEEENKTKPKVTMEIEGADEGITADQAALVLFTGLLPSRSSFQLQFFSQPAFLGVEKGHVNITGDLITSLFRSSTRGSAPYNNWFIDAFLDSIAYVCAFFVFLAI